MKEILQIDSASQAAALLQPMRLDMMRQLAEPRTCTELAANLGASVQQVNYHMRKLEESGFVDRVEERRVRGTVEGIYQARASTIWISPRLVSLFGAERVRQEMSLGYLLSLAEDLQLDVARLAAQQEAAPALGLSATIELAGETDRERFLKEVQKTIEKLAAKYGATGKTGKSAVQPFRLMLACYQSPPGSRASAASAPAPRVTRAIARKRTKSEGD